MLAYGSTPLTVLLSCCPITSVPLHFCNSHYLVHDKQKTRATHTSGKPAGRLPLDFSVRAADAASASSVARLALQLDTVRCEQPYAAAISDLVIFFSLRRSRTSSFCPRERRARGFVLSATVRTRTFVFGRSVGLLLLFALRLLLRLLLLPPCCTTANPLMVLPLHVGHTPKTSLLLLQSLPILVLDGGAGVDVDAVAAAGSLPGSPRSLLGGCAGGLPTLLFLLYPDDCAVAVARVSLAAGAGSLKPPVGGSVGVLKLPLPSVVPDAVANADVGDARVAGDCDATTGSGAGVRRRTNVAGSSILA